MDFEPFAVVFDKLERTSSRLELSRDLAALFTKVKPTEAREIVYLLQGVLRPAFDNVELGVADKLCIRALALSAGMDDAKVDALYKKVGDLGAVAEQLSEKKTQTTLGGQALTTQKVYANFYKLATTSGSGSQDLKIKLLLELLSNASPGEARVIIRFATGRLRLGVGDATIIDALSYYATRDTPVTLTKKGKPDPDSGPNKSLSPVFERAYNLRSDLGWVAEQVIGGKSAQSLETIGPEVFSPIRPALAERLPTSTEILEAMGGECVVEGKYDGFRLQIHKRGDEVRIYSRRQELLTHSFPDVVEGVRRQFSKTKELILEGEALGYNEETDTFLPFQSTMTRRRKHDITAKAVEVPLKLFAFELLLVNGKDFTGVAFRERRAKLESLIEKDDVGMVAPSKLLLVKKPESLDAVFEQCVADGLEGVIAKDLNAPYVAGGRKFAWIKLKKSYQGNLSDTLDLVILGYYVGKGKRTEFNLGGLLAGVYDDTHDRFRTICKIGTGFSEVQLASFFELLSKIKEPHKPPSVDSELTPDAWVVPKYVVTVRADELTRSPLHTAGRRPGSTEGLALRFPRLQGDIRPDKQARDATTETEALEMFEQQRQG